MNLLRKILGMIPSRSAPSIRENLTNAVQPLKPEEQTALTTTFRSLRVNDYRHNGLGVLIDSYIPVFALKNGQQRSHVIFGVGETEEAAFSNYFHHVTNPNGIEYNGQILTYRPTKHIWTPNTRKLEVC